MATTAGLVTRCKSRFSDTSNQILQDADWVAYLNDAYSWVQALPGPSQWPFAGLQNKTFSYPASTSTPGGVALPVDCGVLNVVFDVTDEYILEPFPTRLEAYIQFPNVAANAPPNTGSPNYYRIIGQNIEIWPPPAADTTLLIEYEGPLTALASGSVDPVIPDRHCQTLVEYALYLAYTDDDDPDSAQVHLQRAQDMLEVMKADLLGARNTRNYELVDEWF